MSFAFINFDPSTSTLDAEENRRRVRSHVTKRTYEEQHRDKPKDKKPAQGTRTLLPRPSQVQQPSPASTLRGSSSEADGEGSLKKQKHIVSVPTTGKKTAKRKLAQQDAMKQVVFELLTPSKGIHAARLDPFGLLPRDLDPKRIDRTMEVFKIPMFKASTKGLMPHSGVFFWGRLAGVDKAWTSALDFDEHDPLVLVERLHNASFIYDRLRHDDRSSDTMFFYGKAIGLVRSRLAVKDASFSNELIVSIMSIGLFAAAQGDYAAAQAHNEAGWRCINLRGGFGTLPLTMRRLIAWADIVARIAVRQRAGWNWQLTIDETCDRIPEDLSTAAFLAEQATFSALPERLRLAPGIIYKIHVLGFASSTDWAHYEHHPSISNVWFYLLYHLHEMSIEQPSNLSNLREDTDIMIMALANTARFFIRGTLAPSFDNAFTRGYVGRIRMLIESGRGGLAMWARNGALHALLWILTATVCTLFQRIPIRDWYLVTIQSVAQSIGITTKEAYRDAIMMFPWTTRFGETICEEMWEESLLLTFEQVHTPDGTDFGQLDELDLAQELESEEPDLDSGWPT